MNRLGLFNPLMLYSICKSSKLSLSMLAGLKWSYFGKYSAVDFVFCHLKRLAAYGKKAIVDNN